MGYPSVKGRLHTRYSPVRHSHESKLSIPFDLHVLGLPLAFILSQDQTLRCNIKVKCFPCSDVTQFFIAFPSLFFLFPIFSMNFVPFNTYVSLMLYPRLFLLRSGLPSRNLNLFYERFPALSNLLNSSVLNGVAKLRSFPKLPKETLTFFLLSFIQINAP